jgi:hypothetical protein
MVAKSPASAMPLTAAETIRQRAIIRNATLLATAALEIWSLFSSLIFIDSFIEFFIYLGSIIIKSTGA